MPKADRITAFNRIVAREMANLSDSIQERKSTFEDLLALMPRNHELGGKLRDSLACLYKHEILQRELPLLFAEHAKGTK